MRLYVFFFVFYRVLEHARCARRFHPPKQSDNLSSATTSTTALDIYWRHHALHKWRLPSALFVTLQQLLLYSVPVCRASHKYCTRAFYLRPFMSPAPYGQQSSLHTQPPPFSGISMSSIVPAEYASRFKTQHIASNRCNIIHYTGIMYRIIYFSSNLD